MKESCPGSKEIRTPYPEELICVFCMHKNEIWTDEPDTVCTVCNMCGKTITRDMRQSCLQWCPAAKECVGTEKYDRLMKKINEQ